MINDDGLIKNLTDKLCGTLPGHLSAAKKDIAKNFQVILQDALSQLGLVSREEFDAQAKVLARTRQKVEALEARLNNML